MALETFDRAFAGMSATSLYARPWQISYVEDLDVTRYADRVVGGERWVKEVETNDNKMYTIFEANGSLWNSFVWFAGEGGEIYNTNSADDTPELTLTNTQTIFDGTKLSGNIFLLQWPWNTFRITRMIEENAAWGSTSGIVQDAFTHNTWETSSSDNFWITTFANSALVVHKWDKLYILLVAANNDITIDQTINVWKTIAWVVASISNIKVYTNDGDIRTFNAAYELISTVPTWIGITSVRTVNNIDVCVGRQWVYRTNGNTLVPIFRTIDNDVLWQTRLNVSNQNVAFDGNEILFSVQQALGNNPPVNKIASYGADLIGFPEALMLHSPLNATNTILNSWEPTRFNFYAGVIIDGVEQIIRRSNSKDNREDGVLYLEQFNAGNNTTKKQLSEVRVNGKFTNSAIKMVYDWVEHSLSVPLNNGGNRGQVEKTNLFVEEWSTLVIKIELDGADEWYGTEIVYEVIDR